jgi:hypothetical protein
LVSARRPAEAVAEAGRAASLVDPDHPFHAMALGELADALLARGSPGDSEAALGHARTARATFDADPERIEEPAPLLRVHLDALVANGLYEEAEAARASAQAWVTERAGKISSERYRRTFLHDEPDVARIMGHS